LPNRWKTFNFQRGSSPKAKAVQYRPSFHNQDHNLVELSTSHSSPPAARNALQPNPSLIATRSTRRRGGGGTGPCTSPTGNLFCLVCCDGDSF
jgi:hypothetical protein